MPDFTVGEIAAKCGVSASAIRYYEKRGLLPPAPRAHGRRCYDERAVERLAMVRFATRVGFSLAETRRLLAGGDGRPPPQRWRTLAHKKLAQIDKLVAEASAVRILLLATLDRKCPRLVERGRALARGEVPMLAAMNWPNREGRSRG